MDIGETLAFGRIAWRVLQIAPERVLLLADEILELRWYHDDFVPVTWADCALRAYLNGDFYARFTPAEQSRILPVTLANPDNPWFRTPGGPDTVDRVFLLSLEDVCSGFGDSLAALRTKGRQIWRIDDQNNARRQACYRGEPHSWRLRSPGYYGRTSAGVTREGHVYLRGNGVYGRPRDGGGLRPALWLAPSS